MRRGVVGGDPSSEEGAIAVAKRPHLLAGEDMLPEPLQKRSLERRARLKAAGLALFGEKGYEGTSVDEIARRARLPVGSFYQHFRSKRQLLIVLMDELIEKLSQIEFNPKPAAGVREVIRALLTRAFSRDLRYLGAHRAWQEASLTDRDLARKQSRIHDWTTMRVLGLFKRLRRLPGSRSRVDLAGLARAMDGFFWSLLAQAAANPKVDLSSAINSATHMIYHSLFEDAPSSAKKKARKKRRAMKGLRR